MGNKLGRRRQVVDERYTKPQGLYVHKDVDHKKLRKLILESKLAPCYPGDEELSNDHEECPICFLYYPSLNRSRCCLKGICTECFLQMKNPNSTRPTQCPFCKTSNYAVEYRGVKTKEEKGLEQIEEQRVIEAKIRMRQQELQDEEERMQKRLESSASSSTITPSEIVCASPSVPSYETPAESDETSSSQRSIAHPADSRRNRDDEFDVDLEDIMVMEAIWMSIQENDRSKYPFHDDDDAASSRRYPSEGQCTSLAVAPPVASTSSPSGGLACAIAALAERQQMTVEPSRHQNGNTLAFNVIPGSSSFCNRTNQGVENYPFVQHSSIEASHCRMATTGDEVGWSGNCRSDAAGVGSSYLSSGTQVGEFSAVLPSEPLPLPLSEGMVGSSMDTGSLVPESFEEQMMMAMAVSLAEAGATPGGPGSTWQ